MRFSLRKALIVITLLAVGLAFAINAIDSVTQSSVKFTKLRIKDSTATICFAEEISDPPDLQTERFALKDIETEFESKGHCNYEIVILPEGYKPDPSTASLSHKFHRYVTHRIPDYDSHFKSDLLHCSTDFNFLVKLETEYQIEFDQPLPILDFAQLQYVANKENSNEHQGVKCTVWLVPNID